jgi:hypothetical protein
MVSCCWCCWDRVFITAATGATLLVVSALLALYTVCVPSAEAISRHADWPLVTTACHLQRYAVVSR